MDAPVPIAIAAPVPGAGGVALGAGGDHAPAKTAVRRARATRFALAAILILLCSGPVSAEIYQWVDEEGTIHFTDELSAVPPAARAKARPLLREPPVTLPAPPTRTYLAEPGTPSDTESPAESDDFGDPVTQAEQLRAKIAAKEQLIKSVDDKRSLATNPLRNRFVSPSDMELYRKYQAELPADRERLKELEAQIGSLNQ